LARLPRDTLLAASGDVATALYALGDHAAAAAMLTLAVSQHEHHITIHGRSAPYDGLRRDPRTSALIASIESTR
jgi:hypothetical protein